jgi:hypothetical protein
MLSVEVSVNGQRVCVAGLDEPCVLTSILTLLARDLGTGPAQRELTLQISGLRNDDHSKWASLDVKPGDTVTLRVGEGQQVDPPQFIQKGSAAFADAERRRYFDELKKQYGE